MDYITFFLSISFILACIHFLRNKLGRWKSGKVAQLPPGPYPLPIIGSIFKLGNKPHHSLAALSKSYGPLMSLKLGSRTTIVVSSPEIAKYFFHINDRTFSSRTIPYTGRVVDHDKFSMVWLPVGNQKWGRLRRIAKEHLFSSQQLDISLLLRQKKIQELLNHVDQCCINGEGVNIGTAAFTTTLNLLSNFIFSTDFAQYDSLSSQEFKDTVWSLLEIVGKPNLPDFFPIFRHLDPQGLFRKGNVYAEKLLAVFDRIINQRLQATGISSTDEYLSTSTDALDVLLGLSLKDESEFTQNDMRHLFLDLFIAGTDTTSSTLEWAIAELIRNPEKMAKARSELQAVIGQEDNRLLKESDITKLPYLQCVVKETFRLHPAVPFLVPHKALSDVEIQGFIVPKDAQILCNVWAIGRDPAVWSNPDEFMPERFLDTEIDFRGQSFELIPFGAGRRICPGLPLAHSMLHLMLGSLIYKYDWKLEGEMRPEDMDMSDKFALTLQRNVPLVAIPIKV